CPGTTVMHMAPPFRGYGYGWFIEGCLFAVGTEIERIIFTAEYPVYPAWSGLYFYESDNDFYPSRLKYCDIEYVNNWLYPEIPYWQYFWDGYGAAVNLFDYSNIRISYSEFRYNVGVLGGGIGVHGESFPFIEENLFNYNFALGGGGIFWSPNFVEFRSDRPVILDSTFTVANNTFENNLAVSGGAIYLQQHLEEFYDRDEFDADVEVEIANNVLTNNISIGNLYLDEVLSVLDDLGIYISRYDRDGIDDYWTGLRNVMTENDIMAAYQENFSNSRFQIWSGGGGIFSGNLSPYIHDNEIIGNGALGIYDEEHWYYGNYTYNFFASRGGGIFTGLDPIYYFFGDYRDVDIPNPVINNNLVQDNFTYSKTDEEYHYVVLEEWDIFYAAIGSGAGVYNSYQYLELTGNTIV
ncbi:MAG: hypothetical protein KAT74_06180, partial [Candidatus Cloacimonetes bacterium]|nr:hypothetical protein [Candidatus Cloacimonadota bacterium]